MASIIEYIWTLRLHHERFLIKLNYLYLSGSKKGDKYFLQTMAWQKGKWFILFFYIRSQFTHCRWMWVFCTKHSFSRISNIHKRCLHLTQINCTSNFKMLSDNTNGKLLHQKFIKLLLVEACKYLNGFSPYMNTIFNLS